MIWSYFYPRSPCGERQYYSRLCFQSQHISIHALLAESDAETAKTSNADTIFLSTLSLRRATALGAVTSPAVSRFLSTLSLRRATQQKSGDGKAYVDFYPRSPCGERHTPVKAYNIIKGFLSTLSLRRATQFRRWTIPRDRNFYPRSPCGERLWPGLLARPFFLISIHALLAESDLEQSSSYSAYLEISIHALLAESDVE